MLQDLEPDLRGHEQKHIHSQGLKPDLMPNVPASLVD